MALQDIFLLFKSVEFLIAVVVAAAGIASNISAFKFALLMFYDCSVRLKMKPGPNVIKLFGP
jgi:hypothetical protein